MDYIFFLGALVTAQLPYLFMLSTGYFFGRIGFINKEGLETFAKMNIEMFLPIYLFIQVCRSTFVYNYSENGVIVISFIFYFLIATAISLIWVYGTKMDLRYRFTFIMITAITDIKRLYIRYISSFCYFIKYPNAKETDFCKGIDVCANIHVFLQGIIIWYIGNNLIKLDKSYQLQTENLWRRVMKENKEIDGDVNKEDDRERDKKEKNDESFNNEDKRKIKKIYSDYAINPQDEIRYVSFNKDKENKLKDIIVQIEARQTFYGKTQAYEHIQFFHHNESWKEALIILFKTPLIGLFSGFVVGWIRVIRLWIFATNTPVYLFYDTFNMIGNCNIYIGFMLFGANLSIKNNTYQKENGTAKIRTIDYVAHSAIKLVIMPFLGNCFSFIAIKYSYIDNKVLNWACFTHWMLPSSIDLIAIAQVRDINLRFMAWCFLIQLLGQILLNNLLNVPPFLKMVDILDNKIQ